VTLFVIVGLTSLIDLFSMSEVCLARIKAAMAIYKKAKDLVTAHQLDFVTEEVSNKLETVKKRKKLSRVLEITLDLNPVSALFVRPVIALTNLGSNTEESRTSIIKNLEANLTFLTKSRDNLNQSLTVLFDAWDAYVGQKFDNAATKASQSEDLARKAVRDCLVGIAREYIRRAQSRISTGKRIFAHRKDARKKLDQAMADFSLCENKLDDSWTTETEATLQLVIRIAKEAGVDAQYSIDDAQLPFLVTIVTVVLSIIGGAYTLYLIIKSLGLA
jgi:hypothetical protein